MQFNLQKDQLNHCRNRLRSQFNGNLQAGTVKSGPDGQNLHLRNTNQEVNMNFYRIHIKNTMNKKK